MKERLKFPLMNCRWDGYAFHPLGRYADQARDHCEPGSIYTLTEYVGRSQASHNHEFAWIAEAWKQLPEDVAPLYPTPEHLRKRSLIDCGFYDEVVLRFTSARDAVTVAAREYAHDDFALVSIVDNVVSVRTAKSQSTRGKNAMSGEEFQRSKTAILELIAGMIGVKPGELINNAGKQL